MTALVLIAYLAVIAIVSRFTSRGSASDFYSGGRKSPWLMVAIGMVGASVSGVTFVSVPGMVMTGGMSYLQMCLGFIPGYLIVAYLLLPIYYKRGGASIYGILSDRLGEGARRTGALFFIISDLVGTAVKFYLACYILQQFVFDPWGLPFALTVPLLVMAIWLYTRRGGVKTLVCTDVLQTACMVAALLLILYNVCSALGLSVVEAAESVCRDPRSRIFVMDDCSRPDCFWKMFISGAFTVVVMTGLNQNMMQKNLTCRTLPQAQKNMVMCSLLFMPVNALLLGLGILLCQLAASDGMTLPTAGDQLLPMFVASGRLGQAALLFFTLGVASAAFSSADSSLTALTTATLIDLAHRPDDLQLRRRVHLALALLIVVLVYALHRAGSGSLIDTVYTLVGYTYGPLLALFLLAKDKQRLDGSLTMAMCVAAPIATWAVCRYAALHGYRFGYELLLINAAFAYIPLKTTHIILSNRKKYIE